MTTQISLKAARVNAGYTLENAAKEIGIHKTTLFNWEQRPWIVSALYMDKISKVYHLSINDINFLPKN